MTAPRPEDVLAALARSAHFYSLYRGQRPPRRGSGRFARNTIEAPDVEG